MEIYQSFIEKRNKARSNPTWFMPIYNRITADKIIIWKTAKKGTFCNLASLALRLSRVFPGPDGASLWPLQSFTALFNSPSVNRSILGLIAPLIYRCCFILKNGGAENDDHNLWGIGSDMPKKWSKKRQCGSLKIDRFYRFFITVFRRCLLPERPNYGTRYFQSSNIWNILLK